MVAANLLYILKHQVQKFLMENGRVHQVQIPVRLNDLKLPEIIIRLDVQKFEKL